jgi:LCP family protein required for cell wall assembly
MEDSGGLSVSDLVAKHGSSRSDLKPVAPPPHVDQPSGSHRLTAPTPPPATNTGSHRRALPDEPPSQPRIAPRSVSPSYGMQPQGTGRTRSGNDTAPGQPFADAGSQKMPRPVAGGQRAATPRANSSARAAAPRRGAGQPSGPQRIPQQPVAQQPPAAQQPAARQQAPGQNSGQQRPVGGQWDGQQGRAERSGPLPAPGPLGGAGVAMPARNPRTGRPTSTGRVPRGRTVTPPATRGNPMPAIPAPAPNPLPTTPQAPAPSLPAPSQAGPGSRPGMLPVGRQTATALAVPVRKPVPAAETTVETPTTAAAPPERREDIDPSCLTTEMEAISEVVQQKRKVDATLARFSAVHDEMAEEERVRRGRRVKLMPWLGKDDDMEEALSVPPLGSTPEPEPLADEVDERASAPGGTRLQEKLRRRGSRTLRSTKIAVMGVAALVLVGCYFGWRAATHVTSSQIQEVAALDENSAAIIQGQKQYGDSNFLLVGTTSRPGASTTGDQSTNTLMVVHIPVDGSRAVIVSFPPNLQVDRPACKQWNNQTNQVGGDVAAKPAVKLNSIYATGGPRCLTDTVQQVTGLRINHFVGIDLDGFRNLASSVGGVDMCVKAPLQDAALGAIVNRAGPVSLSGDQALNFVRADQIMGATGVADFTRIDRQQKFLAALLRKTIGQQNLLMDASLLNRFLGAFTTSTFGDNMGVSSLSKLATSLQGLALGRITFVTLPTTGTLNQAGDETVKADTSKQLFTAVIDNAPLPGEAAATNAGANAATTNAPAATPQNTKIQVINATNTLNVATTTANALSQQGFVIVGKGGVPPPNIQQTLIKYAAAQQDQARLLASAVPSATLQVDPSMDGAIQLIIGPGFDHKVQAPQAGGSNGAAPSGGSEVPAQLSYVNAADTACA